MNKKKILVSLLCFGAVLGVASCREETEQPTVEQTPEVTLTPEVTPTPAPTQTPEEVKTIREKIDFVCYSAQKR